MASIIAQVSANVTVIADIIERYDDDLQQAEAIFNMDGQKLESLCKLQARNLWWYTSRLNDLKSLEDFFRTKLAEHEGQRWKHYLEKYSRALGTRDIQAYIAGEPEYVKLMEIVLEVAHLKKQYEAVVDALKDANWMLSHITKLRVAELEDAVL